MSEQLNTSAQWQRAFVLHSRPFSETSLMPLLFCEKQGLITAVAKGVRTKRSAQKAYLQPFTPLLVKYIGKGDVKTITAIEPISLTLPLTHIHLYSGMYLNELSLRVLTAYSESSEIFGAYLRAVQSLALQNEMIEAVLRRYELAILKHLGYEVDFFHCAGSGLPIAPDMTYLYYPEKGFIASLMKRNDCFVGKDLLDIGNHTFSEKSTLLAAKRFTRIALKPYVGNKPFKSRELFSDLSANR